MTKSRQYAVRLKDGTIMGPLTIHKVQELLSAGHINHDDRIAIIGQTFFPIHQHPLLKKIKPIHKPIPPQQESTFSSTSSDIFEGLAPVKIFYPTPNEQSNDHKIARYAGNLQIIPFVRLFFFFHVQRDTGRLLLINEEKQTREIFWEKGIIKRIEVTSEQKTLEQRLLNKGLCSLNQLTEGLERLALKGGNLGDHLVALNYIQPYTLFEILQEQFDERILESFAWFKGRYFFFNNEKSKKKNDIPFRFDSFNLLKQGIYRYYSLKRLEWILEPHYNRVVTRPKNPDIDPNTLNFSPQEARIYNLMNKPMTLWRIIEKARKTNVAELVKIYQFLYFLGQMELILFDNKYLGPSLECEVPLLDGR